MAISVFAIVGCGSGSDDTAKKEDTAKKSELILATTTSTQDTGLLDVLLPEFEKEYGITVKPIAVGTGEALKMGEDGDADVVMVHAKASEEEFIKNGFGLERVEIMYNDFIIVGPEADPAGIKGLDAVEAFKKIAGTNSTFLSRGDDSGTHKKELTIWKEAGIDPKGQPWYIETGQGQSNTLTVANEKQGYMLSDRATYLSMKESITLVILVEGSKSLLNQYSVIICNPEKHPNLDLNVEGAADFVKFLTSEEGQEMIGSFEKYNTALFHPNARGETDGLGNNKE
ncbi:MAG: extracellular solute-binding protein [Actinobacteria bacterium]|nr:extracellular solute-binding protein [Actinomycetota bacterium]